MQELEALDLYLDLQAENFTLVYLGLDIFPKKD